MSLLMPKRTSFRKVAKRGQVKGRGGGQVTSGAFGLMARVEGRITARQIEATRRAIRHQLARQGKRWISIFPHRPVTGKPREVRMGGGAGSIKYWATIVKPGTMLFEVAGVDAARSTKALRSGATKLPIPVRVIARPQCRY